MELYTSRAALETLTPPHISSTVRGLSSALELALEPAARIGRTRAANIVSGGGSRKKRERPESGLAKRTRTRNKHAFVARYDSGRYSWRSRTWRGLRSRQFNRHKRLGRILREISMRSSRTSTATVVRFQLLGYQQLLAP